MTNQDNKSPRLNEEDTNVLRMAILQRKLILQEAKTALANHELAESNYKNTILKLYLKYNLKQTDTINENGDIISSDNSQKSLQIEGDK